MKITRILTSICLVALIASVAWAQEGDKEPIKIGAIFAISGRAAFLGEPERNTAVMLVDKINEEGGIDGRPIQLLIEDTEGVESVAVMAVKKLIGQDVVAIIGPSTSGVTMAVLPICNSAEVPLISCAAAAPIVEPVKDRKWIFKTPQMDSDCVVRIFEHMKEKSIDKIAIITATTGFGQSGRGQLLNIAKDMDIDIVADETYGPADTDMTAQLTKIKASDAKAVVNWSIGPTQSIIPKNMKQLGMKIPLYQSHGFGNIEYAKAAGEAAEGIIFPAGRLIVADVLPEAHPQKELLTEYKKNYEERFKGEASTFGGHAYDALTLTVKAIEMGQPTREAIRDNMEKINGFVGTAGIFNMSPTDHVGLDKNAFEMITVKDGKFVLLQD